MTTDNITCKTCSKKDIPNWDGMGNCITCARDNVLGVDETWIEEILSELVGKTIATAKGEEAFSYAALSLDAEEAIQKQLKRAELRGRIDGLAAAYGFATMFEGKELRTLINEDIKINWFNLNQLLDQIINHIKEKK